MNHIVVESVLHVELLSVALQIFMRILLVAAKKCTVQRYSLLVSNISAAILVWIIITFRELQVFTD